MLCPTCRADVIEVEKSLISNNIDDFYTALFIISNCDSCYQLVQDLLQERADILKLAEELVQDKEKY